MKSITESTAEDLSLFIKIMDIEDYNVLINMEKVNINVIEDDNGIMSNDISFEALDEYILKKVSTHLQVEDDFFYLNIINEDGTNNGSIFQKLRSNYEEIKERATARLKNGMANDFIMRFTLTKEEETNDSLLKNVYCISMIKPIFMTTEMINDKLVAQLVFKHENVHFEESLVDEEDIYTETLFEQEAELARIEALTGIKVTALSDEQLDRLLSGNSPFMTEEEEETYRNNIIAEDLDYENEAEDVNQSTDDALDVGEQLNDINNYIDYTK